MSAHEQWGQIKELFETARILPAEQRQAYVEAHTTGEARAELLSLLETYGSMESGSQVGEFLETPAAGSVAEILNGGWAGNRFGPYEARRLLGEGGMGSVYEGARADGVFEQRVAIKIMKPELVSAHLLERFRQERQILASLDHPHIARLLDGGEREASPWPVPYMVMEFIDGVPITQYVAANQLDGRQCAALAADVCDAVEYAHGRQVIHRDIKPGNVMVDPSGRVKLLDFGISKIVTAGGEAQRTATLMRMATPDYASPEQLRGAASGPAGDIFSLGALLYEMASGTRLSREHWIPLASGPLDRIARKACAARVEDRYQSAGEFSADLRRYIAGQRILAPRAPRRRRVVWTAAAAVCMLAALAGWWRFHGVHGKPTVAVLQLRNLSGRPAMAWVSTAATEVLASELSAGGAVRVIPGELTVRAARDLNLEPADGYSRETLRKLRTYLNADRIVTGSFLSISDQPADPLRFQFRMQDTRSGAIETPVTESASLSELSAMATRASGRFRQALGVATASGKGPPEAKPEALRSYADGLNFQRNFDAPKAREALEQAIALDPSFAMAHFRLSQVFRTLGKTAQADAEVQLARQTAGGLRPEDRLLIEGAAILRGPVKQRPDAVAVFRKLLELDPSSIDFELLLGNAQMQVNDTKGTTETLRDLRTRQQAADVGRIDLFEADLAYRHGEYAASQKAASHCAEAARNIGSRLMMAECLLKAGQADQVNGDSARALTELQQAQEIFSASGNRNRLADARNGRAGVFLHMGKPREALEEFQAVAEISRDIANEHLEAAAQSNVGMAYAELGETQQAAEAHLKAIAVLKRLHDTPNLSYAQVNLATAYMSLGDLRAADQAANQGLVYAREAGGALEGNALLTLAGIREWEGRFQEAGQMCGQALDGFEKTGAKRYVAYARSMLGELHFDSGDDSAAAAEYKTALDLARQNQENDLIPLIYSDQARLALAAGDYPEAVRLAGAALRATAGSPADGKDLLWHAYLALALATESQAGPSAEQEQLIAHGQMSKARPDIRIQMLTVEGWLKIGQKRFKEAVEMLEEARKMAAEMPPARGEAELALAEAHFGMGDRAAAAAELRALAARAPGTRAAKLARNRLAHGTAVWRPMP